MASGTEQEERERDGQTDRQTLFFVTRRLSFLIFGVREFEQFFEDGGTATVRSAKVAIIFIVSVDFQLFWEITRTWEVFFIPFFPQKIPTYPTLNLKEFDCSVEARLFCGWWKRLQLEAALCVCRTFLCPLPHILLCTHVERESFWLTAVSPNIEREKFFSIPSCLLK